MYAKNFTRMYLNNFIRCPVGPERLSKRYTTEKCSSSPWKDTTFSDVFQQLLKTQAESNGKFIIAKDMALCANSSKHTAISIWPVYLDIVKPYTLATSPRTNPTVFSGIFSKDWHYYVSHVTIRRWWSKEIQTYIPHPHPWEKYTIVLSRNDRRMWSRLRTI